MQLLEIDKKRYRKHLNIVIGLCIVALVVGSLGIAQILIAIYPSAEGTHFHWNLFGVIVTVIAIGVVLKQYKAHPFMTEVVYVWELKKVLNVITRKMQKIQSEAEQGNVQALLALQFSYSGSRQLWTLDDNTILMDELAVEQAKLNALLEKFSLQLDLTKFDKIDLQDF
ncbi:DUF3087 domain-containing protein [Opacimonas viscosa]|uniref:DUF3087 domain-containing protein n=1 Tax=Opacimonas viscosa TaxID=2961944 RepID=A0AA42BLK3_9ALTE|nr:DUF3087 domain-containing protein [Opacimonas viscosa]MCP3428694.1 DUF3087 domain-containing protein [Opacimonas viscosa]